MGENLQFDLDFKLLNIFYKLLNSYLVMMIKLQAAKLTLKLFDGLFLAKYEQ
jgi:hypothetical protein